MGPSKWASRYAISARVRTRTMGLLRLELTQLNTLQNANAITCHHYPCKSHAKGGGSVNRS